MGPKAAALRSERSTVRSRKHVRTHLHERDGVRRDELRVHDIDESAHSGAVQQVDGAVALLGDAAL